MLPEIRALWTLPAIMAATFGLMSGQAIANDDAARQIGARLFAETRFAQAFAAERRAGATAPGGPAGEFFSCQTCHFASPRAGIVASDKRTVRAFCDFAERSPVPARDDGRSTTPRNSPTLVDALSAPDGHPLLHYDGEFATAKELVKETFLGRNFGWLPSERAEAKRHFARVIREDDGRGELAASSGHLSYAVLLRGGEAAIPMALRLPGPFRFDPVRASDDEVLDGCARLVAVFLRSLQFSRDADNLHNGSPYDVFLAINHLPRAAARGQTPHEYAHRLGEAVAALRAPRYIDEPTRRLQQHDQGFRFGELELRGMGIFFKAAVGAAQTGGAGNCAECHVPPHFSDFSFHNTGVAQEEYDALHGPGTFARLEVPSLAARAADYDRWLQPTPQHPQARGVLLAPAARDFPGRADLGLWNVYGNPDLPAPQSALEHLLNPNGRLTRDELLASTVARFKTPTVRDLGQSAPYLHTGQLHTIEDVIAFYQRTSALAHEGRLRNAPPEFFGMRLETADIAPLAAFLRALNEDFTRD